MPNPSSPVRPARRGLLILAGLVLAAVVTFNLPSIQDLFRQRMSVVALVPSAPGVRVGTDVWAEGVRIGRVSDVQIIAWEDTTYVALALRISPRATAVVTPASDVRVVRRRLIGEPAVRIAAGSPGDPVLQEGDTLVGYPRMSPEELIAMGAALPAALDSLLNAVTVVQASFESRRPALITLESQIRDVLDATGALARAMETGSLGRMLDPETGAMARFDALRDRVAELGAAAERMGQRYDPDAEDGIAAAIERVAERARDVEATLAALEAEVEEGAGFLGRMAEDTAIQVAIRGVQLQIDSLMAEAWSIALRMFLP